MGLRPGRSALDELVDDIPPDSAPTGPPVPTCPIEFSQYCIWPAFDGDGNATGLAPAPMLWAKDRASFRIDENGKRIGGRDWIRKARKMFFTTAALDFLAWGMCLFPDFLALTVIHKKEPSISGPMVEKFQAMLCKLPHHWTGGVHRSGLTLKFKGNRSQWNLSTAGSSEDVAEGLVSGTVHALHFTETGKFRYPDLIWKAIVPAMPPNGWFISETTAARSPSHWSAQQWGLVRQGEALGKAHFSPWYANPAHRYPASSDEYRQVMAPEFAAKMPQADIDREDELDLSEEQRAFRRVHRNTGRAEERENAKIEYLETPDEPWELSVGRYLDSGCLEVLRARTIDPVIEDRLGLLEIRVWVPDYDGYIIVGCDYARWGGKDLMAYQFVAAATGEQLAEVSGRSLASEGADAIVTTLGLLGIGLDERHRYICAPERNKDGGDLIGELLKRRVHLRQERDSKGHSRPGVYGLFLTDKTRTAVIRRIVAAVEGPSVDDDGNPRAKGPTVRIYSRWLVHELGGLVRNDYKVEGDDGYHDDLALAFGEALWIAETSKYVAPPPRKTLDQPRERKPRSFAKVRGGPA